MLCSNFPKCLRECVQTVTLYGVRQCFIWLVGVVNLIKVNTLAGEGFTNQQKNRTLLISDAHKAT